jgi:hypothetical protein
MPLIKIAIRPEQKNSAGQCLIYVRLTHRGQTRDIPTPYHIEPGYVKKNGQISDRYSGASKLNMKLQLELAKYNSKILDLDDADLAAMTGQQIKDYLTAGAKADTDLYVYAAEVIAQMKAAGRRSTANSYEVTLKHLRAAISGDTLPFTRVTIQTVKAFELYLQTKERANSINAIAVHLRNLRAIINRAIDDQVTDNYPFRRFRIRTEKAIVNNLSRESLRKLAGIRDQIPGKGRFITPLHRTSDIFMLSFYLVGMNLVDLVNLKPGDLLDGRITYRRAKTRTVYSIKVEPEAMEIIERYRGDEYLLNFLETKRPAREGRTTDIYPDIKKNANDWLKQLQAKLDIQEKTTMYSARYSWASIAAKLDIPELTIAHALGHGLNNITERYIRYERDKIDQANRSVIDALQ